MILNRLFGKAPPQPGVDQAYAAIVAAARHPAFYETFGVADTVDGRFDMIVLHAFLVLDRLKAENQFTQALTDALFADMDRSLREMGAGDASVPKKVRRMAEVFYGRVAAYAQALNELSPPPTRGEVSLLAAALARNVFAGDGSGAASGLARYVRAAHAALAAQAAPALLSGRIDFPEPGP